MRRSKNNQPRFQLAHAWNADQLDQDPLAELGDFPLILELKLQFLNYLRQPLSRKGVCGLHGEPPGLLQLPFQFMTDHARHLGLLPIGRRGSLKCSPIC